MRFIHIFTLAEKKATRQLPTGAYLREIMNSKIIFKTDIKKERTDLRHAISKLHQKNHISCHEQPELAQFTPLWLVTQANTDCSSIARAISKKGRVTCLSCVSHYSQTYLFRKEITSRQSTASLSGIQVLYDPHKKLEVKEYKFNIKILQYSFPANL